MKTAEVIDIVKALKREGVQSTAIMSKMKTMGSEYKRHPTNTPQIAHRTGAKVNHQIKKQKKIKKAVARRKKQEARRKSFMKRGDKQLMKKTTNVKRRRRKRQD